MLIAIVSFLRSGPYDTLKYDGAHSYSKNSNELFPFETEEESPYIEAFWKWLESDKKILYKSSG